MKNAAKGFTTIAEDYEFFMAHYTEAENDVLDYRTSLERFVTRDRGRYACSDFGCGVGDSWNISGGRQTAYDWRLWSQSQTNAARRRSA